MTEILGVLLYSSGCTSIAAKTKLIMDQRKVFKKHLDILCINTEMQVNSTENAVGNLCC